MPNGTVLLIDDEAMLRQAVARTLELEGYTVLQAPTPTGACKPCASRPGRNADRPTRQPTGIPP